MRIGIALAALGGSLLLAAASVSANGGGKGRLTIETHGELTGPGTTGGTFVLTGVVADRGTFVDSFQLNGDTIVVRKTLYGGRGTITLKAQGTVLMTSPSTAGFAGGSWRVLSGTGAYADLQGHGKPGASGSVDFATGVVAVTHAGQARL